MTELPGPVLPDWERANPAGTLQGIIRSRPEDFEVTEVCDFALSGSGEHDYLDVEKTGANTVWVAAQLAKHARVPQRDVGFSGMKDRHAVTRQWFSVRRRSGDGTDWDGFRLDGVRILRRRRHSRKLRRGAHSGNRFRIVVRGIGEPSDDLAERLDQLAIGGVPNYFGEQRFGRGGSNLALAARFFRGEPVPRARRGIAISSARAYIFNGILERRVRAGNWDRLQPGDCAMLDGSNSYFAVPAPDDALECRAACMDLHPSGALWGKGVPGTGDEVMLLEQAVADMCPEYRDGLAKHAELGRRALRLRVQDFDWQLGEDSLHLGFSLAKGGYATAVLREILNYSDLSRARSPG